MLRNLAESDKVSINTDTSVFTKTPKRFKNCSHVLFLNVLISQNRHVYVVHTKTDLQVQKHTYTHKQLDQGMDFVLSSLPKRTVPSFTQKSAALRWLRAAEETRTNYNTFFPNKLHNQTNMNVFISALTNFAMGIFTVIS